MGCGFIVWVFVGLGAAGGIGETEVSVASTVEDERGGVPQPAEAEERLVIQSSAPGGDAVASTVLIAPWGKVTSANGTFVMDEESAQSVIEAFREHGTDLPIDYEHQSLGGAYASPTGQAPAAGWIRSLRAVRPGDDDAAEPGLFANVEWTEAARDKLAAKEYRYLSPVVIVRKRDRRVVALHSAALTNKPAIAGMKPIVNRENAGLTTSPAGVERLEETTGAGEAVETLRLRLGLGSDSDVETVLMAADDRLATLTQEAAEREAREKVVAAIRAGKLTAAQREWAVSLALKDAAAFDEWMASAPVVVTPGRTEAPSGDGGGAGGRDQAAVIASARTAFRSEPALGLLTSEAAWVRDALREAGLESQ